VTSIMNDVLLALLPGTLVWCYLTGWGGILNIVLSVVSCIVIECVVAGLRRQPILAFLSDRSAIVTGALIALCLPPMLPIWLPILACAIALLLGKHVYGGLGHNVFNPAMVGYAAVLVSFPAHLSQWPALPEGFSTSFTQTLSIVFNGGLLHSLSLWDGTTGATILDTLRQQKIAFNTEPAQTALEPVLLLSIAWLIGGGWLCTRKVMSWQIPLVMLATLALFSTLQNSFVDNTTSVPIQLLSGSTMLAAFFIATDPVSAAAGPNGRYVYAAGIGFFIWLIREFGGYPDGIAFAVLLMNCTVPAIDYFETRWRHPS